MEWVVIRGISGYADGTEANENWQTFASVTAASFVVSILNQGNDFEDWPHYQGEQINLIIIIIILKFIVRKFHKMFKCALQD